MEYRLRIWALGHDRGLELTAEEFANIATVMNRLYIAADIEEKLDLLLENYLEYEHELLALGLRYSVFHASLDDQRVFNERRVINRRAVNLFTAARIYVDQVKHGMSRYFQPSASRVDVSDLFAAEYDAHIEYRIAESLRNFVQHRSLPVHDLAWYSRWEEMEAPERRLRFSVVPSISVEELLDEGGFKAEVLAELQASGKSSYPLTPILRRYVESLALVHKQVRSLLSEQADLDHRALLEIRERAKIELREELTGLVVTSSDGDDQVKERHYLQERSWNRRAALIRKNEDFSNLSRRYVSSEHPGDAT
jgi:hypothetical protein